MMMEMLEGEREVGALVCEACGEAGLKLLLDLLQQVCGTRQQFESAMREHVVSQNARHGAGVEVDVLEGMSKVSRSKRIERMFPDRRHLCHTRQMVAEEGPYDHMYALGAKNMYALGAQYGLSDKATSATSLCDLVSKSSSSGDITTLRDQDPSSVGSLLEREEVLWLQKSFGDVQWPMSVHGKTQYKNRWHLHHYETQHEHDTMSSSLLSHSTSAATSPRRHNERQEASHPEAGSDACQADAWPLTEDFGYESDGLITDKHLNLLQILENSDTGELARAYSKVSQKEAEEEPPQVGRLKLTNLREAGKTVAYASRTGTLGQTRDRRARDNWIIKCFFMTPLELVVTKIQRFWRKKCLRRAYIARLLLQYREHQQMMRRHAQVHRCNVKHQVQFLKSQLSNTFAI